MIHDPGPMIKNPCCLPLVALYFMLRSWYPSSKKEMALTYKSTRRFIELVDIEAVHTYGIKLKVFIKILVSDIGYDRLVLPTIRAQISFLSKWKFQNFYTFRSHDSFVIALWALQKESLSMLLQINSVPRVRFTFSKKGASI